MTTFLTRHRSWTDVPDRQVAPGLPFYESFLTSGPIRSPHDYETCPSGNWAMDITYIPMKRGFVYLAAVIDWFTRRVLSWRFHYLSLDFCIEAVEEALVRHGKPDILNTSGSQFTVHLYCVYPGSEGRINLDFHASR